MNTDPNWVMANVTSLIEDTKHNHSPYVVARLIKSFQNWFKVEEENPWICFDLNDDWIKEGDYWKRKDGILIKKGTVVVLRQFTYISGRGWRAHEVDVYGAEHETDLEIRLTAEEKMKLRN